MRSTKDVIENFRIDAKLVRGVIKQLGGDKDLDVESELTDIMNHGIDGGFHGFVYYYDTVAFFKKHRAAIFTLVENVAQSLGVNPVDMVAKFNCLGGNSYVNGKRDPNGYREYQPSVSRCLYGGRLTDDDTDAMNALAWFAGEEVARAFCDI